MFRALLAVGTHPSCRLHHLIKSQSLVEVPLIEMGHGGFNDMDRAHLACTKCVPIGEHVPTTVLDTEGPMPVTRKRTLSEGGQSRKYPD
jgi:hypothetical protein